MKDEKIYLKDLPKDQLKSTEILSSDGIVGIIQSSYISEINTKRHLVIIWGMPKGPITQHRPYSHFKDCEVVSKFWNRDLL